MPPPVETLCTYGESLYYAVKAGDWVRARAAIPPLRVAAAGLRQLDKQGGKPEEATATVETLEDAITYLQRSKALREANHLTRICAEFLADHRSSVPAELALLGYYGRELEIGAAERDIERLRAAATGITEAWRAARPQWIARGLTDEATRFDQLVQRLGAAESPTDYGRLAAMVLDQVQSLEKSLVR